MSNDLERFLEEWTSDANEMKQVFLQCQETLLAISGTRLTFVERPGVTYSLRAEHPNQTSRPLYTMVDVIEDPDGRWISVCFYGDSITDAKELGNFVPEGLLGEDAHCFDVEEPDAELIAYVLERLTEAGNNASA